jgi:hypothetical protein
MRQVSVTHRISKDVQLEEKNPNAGTAKLMHILLVLRPGVVNDH